MKRFLKNNRGSLTLEAAMILPFFIYLLIQNEKQLREQWLCLNMTPMQT
ncbi:TadE/TadG family type IV pilus assembly protein [Oceanobacillus damuensis]|nr:hypothetical protein [Oceanobacillus damuensis]